MGHASLLSASTLSLLIIFFGAQFAFAENIQWSALIDQTLYRHPVVGDPTGDRLVRMLSDVQVSVQYHVRVTNAVSGEVVADGETAPPGTMLQYRFIPYRSEDINWFGTGYFEDSPYGDWVADAAAPPEICREKDVVTLGKGRNESVYAALEVDPPQKTVSAPAGAACTQVEGGEDCVFDDTGTYTTTFDFAPTYGKFYSSVDRNGCTDTGVLKIPANDADVTATTTVEGKGIIVKPTSAGKPGSEEYVLRVPAQSASITITVQNSDGHPTLPSVSSSGSCAVRQSFAISFSSTDPNGHKVRYGVDWNDDGSVDQWVPSSGYVDSGTTQYSNRTYFIAGQKTVRVLAQNDQGASSGWSDYSFNCSVNCPVGYEVQGNVCAATTCQDGFHLVDTECVADDSCNTPDCQGVLAPTASLRTTPLLVAKGARTEVQWSSANAASCIITSTNDDSWNALSGTETSYPITSRTTFTLNCNGYEGANPSTITKTVVVNIAPTYQEK